MVTGGRMTNAYSSIVGIYKFEQKNKDEKYLRMGFLADDTHIISCNHIFKGLKGDIFAKFYNFENITRRVRIDKTKDTKTDIISLRIIEAMPKKIKPIRLKWDSNAIYEDKDIEFQSFNTDEGNLISIHGGVVHSGQDKFRISPKQESRDHITGGISGSIVYDKESFGFIGMVFNTGKASNPLAIPAKKILEFCRDNEIYLMIDHGDWHEQADYIRQNLLVDCDGELLDEPIKNVDAFRKALSGADFLVAEDIKKLNKLSMFVMDQWERIRIKKSGSPCYHNYNYSACDDTHSILIEERLYKLLVNEFELETSLESFRNNYNNDAKGAIDQLKAAKDRLGKISHDELFLLIASAWLHDTGMIPAIPDEEKDASEKVHNYIDTHQYRSLDFIKNNIDELGLQGYPHLDQLKDIIRSHRHKDYRALVDIYSKSRNAEIKTGLLTAYLRLADSLQIPRKIKINTNMIIDFKDQYSRFQWLKSQFVRQINTNRLDHNIIFKLKNIDDPSKNKGHLIALKEILEREMQIELDTLSKIFIENNRDYYISVEIKEDDSQNDEDNYPDKIDFDKFADLLSSIELFEPTISPTSSTVVDIVLNQVKKILHYDESKKTWPKTDRNKKALLTELKEYNNIVLEDILDSRPCHIPIKKIYSFIKDSLDDLDLNKLDEIDEDMVFNKISAKIEYFIRSRDEIKANLPKIANCIIRDGTSILLYGYSTHVVNMLKSAFKPYDNYSQAIRRCPIYICETSTKNEYGHNNKLIYNDGLKYIEALKPLKKLGDSEFYLNNIYYIPDLCAANLFLKKKISKVIFGANGIECDGHVHHTLGHLAIAEMASIHNVPVYVIADSMKIGPVEADPDKQRCDYWVPTDIDKEKLLHREGISTYNPRGDRVPPNLITAIITERGIINPKDIRNHIVFDIMISKDLIDKFDLYYNDEVNKLKNIYIEDINSCSDILYSNGNNTLYRKTISISEKLKCSAKKKREKRNIRSKTIKIDYFLDEMNNYLYIVNILINLEDSEVDIKDYFEKMLIRLISKKEFDPLIEKSRRNEHHQ